MRPSSSPEVAIVFDTLPECRVVLDAVDNSAFLMDAYGGTPSEETCQSWRDTRVRFNSETRRHQMIDAPEPPYFVSVPTWREEPEFSVTTSDVDFVLLAARNILDERKISDRVFNQLTRRTRAAKRIIRTLDRAEIEC